MDTDPDRPDASAAFGRLHPKLQEPLYRMRWTRLRPIQAAAIPEVLDGAGDLILAARTAAGKTEAPSCRSSRGSWTTRPAACGPSTPGR
jgi:ATP-dependent Lhr-like helicase